MVRGGFLIAGIVAVLTAGALPVAAQKGPVAVLPAHTFKGSLDNGPVVTTACRANLERAGYRVVPASEVDAALRKLKVDLTRPQFIPTLQALARELGVAHLIYPRIQGVGVGVNTNDKDEFQATIIVNVAAPSGSGLYHVNQVGQVFRHPGKQAEEAVINSQAAGQAADRLLEGFYKKQKQARTTPQAVARKPRAR